MFDIHMGVPEMEEFWNSLAEKVISGKASKGEIKQYNLIGKALVLLANNPRHPSLQSHEIDVLTARYGTKVWCSYMQNHTQGQDVFSGSTGRNRRTLRLWLLSHIRTTVRAMLIRRLHCRSCRRRAIAPTDRQHGCP